ncbi:MAG TPA: hypothetical protein VK906_13070, partial [Egicoccus sp.]
MSAKRRGGAVELLVAVLFATGLGLLATITVTTDWVFPRGAELGAVALYFVLYLVAEVKPIRMLNRPDAGEFAASATFAYALLLSAPFPLALAAIGLGTLIAERRPGGKKPWTRALFNVAQVLLAFAGGGAVLHAIGATGLENGSLPNVI